MVWGKDHFLKNHFASFSISRFGSSRSWGILGEFLSSTYGKSGRITKLRSKDPEIRQRVSFAYMTHP